MSIFMEFVWGVNTVLRNLGQVTHEGTISKLIIQESLDDHYGPPLDLADVKLEEVDVIDMRNFQLHSQACLSFASLSLILHNELSIPRNVMSS